MNIVTTIKNETNGCLEKTAVIDGDRKFSYSKLFDAVNSASAELKSLGIRPAHRVGFLCGDSIDYIVVSLAVLSLQAVIVPVSASLSLDELEPVLERIDINFLIFDKSVHSRDDSYRIFNNNFFEKDFFLYHRKTKKELSKDYYELNPAFIRFSSGTTGTSKGILLSHESIVERTDAADKALKITSDDVVIWVLSMSFHFVVTILLFLRRGATIVLCGGSFPESLFEGLKRQKGTFIYASPFHYHLLTKSDMFAPDLFKNIRLAISTAMKLPDYVARNFYTKFGLELVEAYGIIEVGLPFINCSNNPEKRGSAGRILPDYEIKIVNPDKNGVGEVYIKGNGMFDAYFSPWLRRCDLISDGWFKTGDLGRLDSEGFLYIAGREKNVINFTGMKIFPYEVESVLNQHPGIKDSLVYGTLHPQYGELPCAKIVLKDDIKTDFDINEIRRFCYKHLAQYKVPKEFHFVSRLDKTASGKLKRWP
ncbi:MAG: acyl--CoA ligase [Desulfobacterales bacterium]|nr:acyl--CoA ligase [Desulfobacterales bacterium]